MSTRTTWRWSSLLMAAVLVLTTFAVSPTPKPVLSAASSGGPIYSGPVKVTDAPAVLPPKPAEEASQSVRVIVRLKDPPLAQYEGGIPGLRATSPKATGTARLNLSAPESRAYLDYLASVQEQFVRDLASVIPEAQVQRQYRVVLNGFAVKVPRNKVELIRTMPGVASVTVEREYHLDMDASLPLIGLVNDQNGNGFDPTDPDQGLWTLVGGHNRAGQGLKIAVIDSGIYIYNPCFDDTGYTYPPGFPKGDTRYTNKKVIVARAYFRPDDPPHPVYDAPDPLEHPENTHGSHVAGTIACNYGTVATLGGGTITQTISGIAPKAWLMNYRVFYYSTSGSSSAYDPELIAALEDAVADGADLIHNSWGGTPLTPIEDDPLVQAYEAAVDAGIVVVFSAGNSGSGQYTIGSPAVGHKFISVAASTTDRIFAQLLNVTGPEDPPTVTVPITLTNVPAVPGSGPAITQTLESPFKFVPANDLGCSPYSAGTFTNQIAVIRRGTCTFATKVTNAYNAGAIGVVVVNNAAGFPIAMGGLETTQIPAVMVTLADGNNIISWYNTHSTTYTPTLEILPNLGRFTDTTQADIIASFSSRGPNLDDTIKPDVTAPGVNILSAVLDGFALYQGTSMSAPHVSGAAALLRQLYPRWTPAQIKSALMTTADYPNNLLTSCGTQGPMCYGAGRINLAKAGDPGLTFNSPSLSFGVRMAGSGPVTLTVTAQEVAGVASTYVITPTFLRSHSAITVTTVPTFAVTPAGTATFDVVLNVGSLSVSGYSDYYGYIEVSDGTHDNRLPFWVRIIPVLPEAQVLLVDADLSTAGLPNYAAIYTTTLENLGISYYYLNASSGASMLLTSSYVNWLRRYPLAIVFTGDGYTFGTLSTFLRAYLAAGGRVLLTGQDIGWYYGEYLGDTLFPLITGAGYVQDDLYGDLGGPPSPTAMGDNLFSGFLAGRIYDFSSAGDGAGNQSAVDEVAARFYNDVDAYPILSTVPVTTVSSLGHLGTRLSSEPTLERMAGREPWTKLGYRVAYLSFGLEGVNNNTGYNTREDLLKRLLDWLQAEVQVTPGQPEFFAPAPYAAALVTATVSTNVITTGVDVQTPNMFLCRWDFGDGTPVQVTEADGNVCAAYHGYSAFGHYPVRVEVTDIFGHKAVSDVFYVQVGYRVYLPLVTRNYSRP